MIRYLCRQLAFRVDHFLRVDDLNLEILQDLTHLRKKVVAAESHPGNPRERYLVVGVGGRKVLHFLGYAQRDMQ